MVKAMQTFYLAKIEYHTSMSVNIGGMSSHSFGYYCISHTRQKTFFVSVAEAKSFVQSSSIYKIGLFHLNYSNLFGVTLFYITKGVNIDESNQ